MPDLILKLFQEHPPSLDFRGCFGVVDEPVVSVVRLDNDWKSLDQALKPAECMFDRKGLGFGC